MAMVDTPTAQDVSRRRFLARVTNGIMGIIGAVVAYIGGRAALSSTGSAQGNWLPASSLTDLKNNEPTPVTLTVSRLDGFREVIDKKTVFLVKTSDTQVAAMDSTCSHLGCLVSWDGQAQLFKCPCHGGVYDRTGAVKDGPPPQALTRLSTRIDGERVLVQV
jgi:menaquinol-cytochrome c reductase iron-sulfur subunit